MTPWWRILVCTLKSSQRRNLITKNGVSGTCFWWIIVNDDWIVLPSCLAHIINLAMQALLTAHSKSEHFDPATPDADLVASRGVQRDEVGLVRAICVKVSIYCFRHIQITTNGIYLTGTLFCAAQRIVQQYPAAWWRWSCTEWCTKATFDGYESSLVINLCHARTSREAQGCMLIINALAVVIWRDGAIIANLSGCRLLCWADGASWKGFAEAEEDYRPWAHQVWMESCQAFAWPVKCKLLNHKSPRPILTCAKHANNAQQAFLTDQGPTLHLALPALEALWKA